MRGGGNQEAKQNIYDVGVVPLTLRGGGNSTSSLEKSSITLVSLHWGAKKSRSAFYEIDPERISRGRRLGAFLDAFRTAPDGVLPTTHPYPGLAGVERTLEHTMADRS